MKKISPYAAGGVSVRIPTKTGASSEDQLSTVLIQNEITSIGRRVGYVAEEIGGTPPTTKPWKAGPTRRKDAPSAAYPTDLYQSGPLSAVPSERDSAAVTGTMPADTQSVEDMDVPYRIPIFLVKTKWCPDVLCSRSTLSLAKAYISPMTNDWQNCHPLMVSVAR